MKRSGRLFDQILDWDNLSKAVHQALRGKRQRQEAVAWTTNHTTHLNRVAEQLRQGTFPFGRYHQFFVHDPKKRLITAPCLEERIVHHAVMNVVEPHLERWLIDDTFACRKGKGVHACLDRAEYFARCHDWFLKLDIRKYFDSIDHQILLTLLEKRFKDSHLLALFSRLIAGYNTNMGKGLPIGSLTSQHLANFYLGWFDRYAKEILRIPGYVRYMDDIVVWMDSYQKVSWALNQIRSHLSERLHLCPRSEPYINRSQHGMDFLGCRIFRSYRILSRQSRVRFRRKLQRLNRLLEDAAICESQYQIHASSLIASVTAGTVRSWRYRSRLLSSQKVGDQEALLG